MNGPELRREQPAIGSDIKVMGVRRADRITLTIGCAFIARHVASPEDYVRRKEAAAALALGAAREVTKCDVDVSVNVADDLVHGDVFLTVTGTSAEAGDDGEAGRGNRTTGLMTPYRSMTMEAAAGKNPVSHVGKLYNVVAGSIANALVSEVPGVVGATCILVSQIGRPVDDPQLLDLQLDLRNTVLLENVRTTTQRIAAEQIGRIPSLGEDLVRERILLY
jgi:S-adenosylmethionine synthetase